MHGRFERPAARRLGGPVNHKVPKAGLMVGSSIETKPSSGSGSLESLTRVLCTTLVLGSSSFLVSRT